MATKDDARAGRKTWRKSLPREVVTQWSGDIQRHFLQTLAYRHTTRLALYAPSDNEVLTDGIFEAARRDGKHVCYPRIPSTGRVLSFVDVAQRDDLHPGRFGLLEPSPSAASVSLEDIDTFVVPCLGVTLGGHRLGRGGGYYDATLCKARAGATFVAFAYCGQVLQSIPTTNMDVRMHVVVTEQGVVVGESA
ncbi:MAG: 5-formyltetrahydrofolate cyclo-ligase [Myxococcaceae bacterium]